MFKSSIETSRIKSQTQRASRGWRDAALTLVAGALLTSSAALADRTFSYHINPPVTVETKSTYLSFPDIFRSGPNVFISISEHADDYEHHPVDSMRISTDSGATFPRRIAGQDLFLTGMVKLPDGTLFAQSYITYRTGARTAETVYWKSVDAINWTRHVGLLTLPQDQGSYSSTKNPDATWGGILFRNVLLMADGSLRASLYGRYATDSKYRSVYGRSNDNGHSWTIVSTIAYDATAASGTEGFCEPDVQRVADGSLLAVMRTGSWEPLQQSRSLDNGYTWSKPVPLADVDHDDAKSVNPHMAMMGNGVLVLGYGRPQMRLLFSLDGSGYRWTGTTKTYADLTSGNGGIREVGTNKLMMVGDGGAHWQNPSIYKIWKVVTNIVPTETQGTKIDLRAKYDAGVATVTTDLNYDSSYFNKRAALDGSAEYEHSATKDGTAPAFYTLDIGAIYRIRSLGISLKPGYTESAQIYFSTDGSSWGTAVKTYADVNTTDIDYTTFTTPINARYVKVNISSVSSGWPMLNELQLFSDGNLPDVIGFEGQTLGAQPGGFSTDYGATVASVAYAGTRSMRIHDASSTVMAQARRNMGHSRTKVAKFAIRPVAAPSANLFSITNDNTTIFHFGIFGDGSLRAYNGTSWVNLTAAGEVPLNTWHQIRIEAVDTNVATVFVNNRYEGFARALAPTKVINTLSFSSGSSAGTGDDFYVDEIFFE
jgi:hypothetical protein